MASLIFFTASSEAWDRKAASLSCVLPVMPAVWAPGANASGVPRSKALAISRKRRRSALFCLRLGARLCKIREAA